VAERESRTSRGGLDFVLDEAFAGDPLKRTIIFFNTRELCLQGFKHLFYQLSHPSREEIDYLHALRTQDAKQHVLNNFQAGKIKILCATEAAGMGMDIPDIERVVQFMLPSSLSILIQRFGRAGRSGQPALAILLVEATAFHTKKNMRHAT